MREKQDTICAISTAPGVGGIAVIRVSGSQAFAIADVLCSQNILTQSHMSLSFGSFMDGLKEVDEVLVSKFIGPRSYTGEDTVEISCHGSEFIQSEIIRLLIAQGCAMAGPGEFTKRAFLNGKLDLSQAEAVADLIASESSASHKLALQQMKGGFSTEIAKLRDKLIEFAALLELELDFSEEDVEFADRSEFKELIKTILARVSELINSFKLGNVMKKGVPVAIVGAPNSGKSTLLNVLLKEQRAIVSDIAGTTRDAIEDTVNIHGTMFRFIDTAGVRETSDEIESRGIELALSKAKSAAIVIKLLDAKEESLPAEERLYKDYFEHTGWKDDERTIVVMNKMDLLDEAVQLKDSILGISAANAHGLEQLEAALLAKVKVDQSSQSGVIVTTARHVEALGKVYDALSTVQRGMDLNIPSDLLAIDLRKALHYLGEVTGEITTDDLLGTIFSRFCIGK